MIGNQRGVIVTLVGRKSIFMCAVRAGSKNTGEVAQAITGTLIDLPHHCFKSITFDNGTESAYHEDITG